MVGHRKWSISACLLKMPVTATINKSSGPKTMLDGFQGLSVRNGTLWLLHHCQNLPVDVQLGMRHVSLNNLMVFESKLQNNL